MGAGEVAGLYWALMPIVIIILMAYAAWNSLRKAK